MQNKDMIDLLVDIIQRTRREQNHSKDSGGKGKDGKDKKRKENNLLLALAAIANLSVDGKDEEETISSFNRQRKDHQRILWP